ncbi:ALQxL family class IV lanthipeptide [Streptomyces sp. NPDC001177]
MDLNIDALQLLDAEESGLGGQAGHAAWPCGLSCLGISHLTESPWPWPDVDGMGA